MAVKEARVHIACLVEHDRAKMLEQQVRHKQELCRTLRARLDAFRTVSANLRGQV